MTIQEDGFSLGRQSERRVRESWERWYENHLGHDPPVMTVRLWHPSTQDYPFQQKRGCEEMRIHFFTASSFMSFFTPGSKKQEEKGILPPFPQKSAF